MNEGRVYTNLFIAGEKRVMLKRQNAIMSTEAYEERSAKRRRSPMKSPRK